jgi:hypothetical protein
MVGVVVAEYLPLDTPAREPPAREPPAREFAWDLELA